MNYPEESKALWVCSPAASFVEFTAGSVGVLLPHGTHTHAHAVLSYTCSYMCMRPGASTKPVSIIGEISGHLHNFWISSAGWNSCLKYKWWDSNFGVTLVPSAMPPRHVTQLLHILHWVCLFRTGFLGISIHVHSNQSINIFLLTKDA